MKRTSCILFVAVSLLASLISCEDESLEFPKPSLEWTPRGEVPEYNTIITNGCSMDSKAKELVKTENLKLQNGLPITWADLGVQIAYGAAQAVGFNVFSEQIAAAKEFLLGPDATSLAFNQILQELSVIKDHMQNYVFRHRCSGV